MSDGKGGKVAGEKTLKEPSVFLYVILPALLIGAAAFLSHRTIVATEKDVEKAHLETTMNSSIDSIRSRLVAGMASLEGVAALWVTSEDAPSEEEFVAFSEEIWPSLNGFLALQWVDEDYVVRYAYPLEGENLSIIGFDNKPYPNRLEPIVAARETGKPVSTAPIFLAQGYPGVVIFRPIFRGEDYLGSAVGVVRLESFFGEARTVLATEGAIAAFTYGETVFDGTGSRIFTSEGLEIVRPGGGTEEVSDAVAVPSGEDVLERHFGFVDKRWKMHARPGNGLTETVTGISFFASTFFSLFLFGLLLLYYLQRRNLVRIAMREKDFISLVSHQLKSPLGQISWGIETLRDSRRFRGEAAEIVGGIEDTARRMNRLVDDLLSVSRIDRGVLAMDRKSVSMRELTNEVMRPLKGVAEKKGVSLEVLGEMGLVIETDPLKAGEAVRNIIDNAVRHSPKGETVSIRVGVRGDVVEIAIQDRGDGIPPSQHTHVFERASKGSKKTFEHSGLGLYLTKTFIVMLGGDVTFTSDESGTVFTVTLPLGK